MMDIIGHIRERRDITREELETLLATKEEETVRQLRKAALPPSVHFQ